MKKEQVDRYIREAGLEDAATVFDSAIEIDTYSKEMRGEYPAGYVFLGRLLDHVYGAGFVMGVEARDTELKLEEGTITC